MLRGEVHSAEQRCKSRQLCSKSQASLTVAVQSVSQNNCSSGLISVCSAARHIDQSHTHPQVCPGHEQPAWAQSGSPTVATKPHLLPERNQGHTPKSLASADLYLDLDTDLRGDLLTRPPFSTFLPEQKSLLTAEVKRRPVAACGFASMVT